MPSTATSMGANPSAPSELDIRAFGLLVVLCLVKSESHRPILYLKGHPARQYLKGRPARQPNAPALRTRPQYHQGEVKAGAI